MLQKPESENSCFVLLTGSLHAQEIWLDQADASLLKEGEEVTLMDWGNAIIEVSFLL